MCPQPGLKQAFCVLADTPVSITFSSFLYTHIFPSLLVKVWNILRDSCKIIWSWWSQSRKKKKKEHIWLVKHRPEICALQCKALYIISEGGIKSQILSRVFPRVCVLEWNLTSLALVPESGGWRGARGARDVWSWVNVGWRIGVTITTETPAARIYREYIWVNIINIHGWKVCF